MTNNTDLNLTISLQFMGKDNRGNCFIINYEDARAFLTPELADIAEKYGELTTTKRKSK